MRHWFARFRRRTCVVSKSIEMVDLTVALFAKFHSKFGKRLLFSLFHLIIMNIAILLFKENDILTFGDISFRVIHTPGHTKGSCCFICENPKIIFSGDTLFKGNIVRYDLYGGNYNVLSESLRKLKAIKDNYKIYPGHGGNTALDDEIGDNPYFR